MKMFGHEDEPRDWEIKDEEPPDKLAKKWEAEDPLKETVECASCKKWIPRNNLTCIFCGARVFEDSGLLGKWLKWIKRLAGR